VASVMEAPAGEDGSEVEGADLGDSLERLTEYEDMALWIEAFSHSGA